MVIAPVLDKSAGLTRAFVRETYKKALELVDDPTAMIVAIGYSFSDHDRASYDRILHALCTTRDRKLILVSPDAVEVKKKLRPLFPSIDIAPYALTFETWVEASFPGINRR